MGKYTEIKRSGGKFISVVVSKTGFDGLNQVGGTDTDPSGEQERSCEVGLGRVKEIYWVNWGHENECCLFIILSKANSEFIFLVSMTQEKGI